MEIRSLAFTPDGKILACMMANAVITVWDLAARKELRQFGDSQIPGRLSMLLSPDGKTLVTNGSGGANLSLWNLTTGKLHATLKADLTWQDSPVISMAFTPDGKVLAGTTMFGARIVFWDARSGELLGVVHFPGRTWSIAFSPDGKTMASAHVDGSVKLWEATKLIPTK
jgi:WD40 repeat protein